MDWITASPLSFFMIGLSTLILFIGLIIMTRLAGVRSFSKMSGFDFAVTVAFGSILASVIVSEDPPVIQGLIALAFLFGIQIITAKIRHRSQTFEKAISNSPRLIMARGQIIPDQLRAACMTEADLMAKLREANVLKLSSAIAVIAETTGDVSVLHADDPGARIDARLLENILGPETRLADLQS